MELRNRCSPMISHDKDRVEGLYAFFILTLSPDECQSKSFEKMNTLLSAMYPNCLYIKCWSFEVKIGPY